MSGVTPDKRKRHHHGGSCLAVTLTQHFNGQAIPKGAWMLFTSIAQFPGNHGALRVQMKDSKIYYFDGTWAGSQASNRLSVYDTASNSWIF